MDDVKIAEECAVRALDELPKTKAVRIKLAEKKTDIFSSKFGGTPYIPHDSAPPETSCGQLRMLAQIDLSEVEHPSVPDSGLLQFWISADDCWGMPDDFKVVYYEDIERTVTEEEVKAKISPMADYETEFFPVHGEFAVDFEAVDETCPTDSREFKQLFLKYYNEATGENWEETWNMPFNIRHGVLDRYNSIFGHKTGGSSDFCQGDPRYPNGYNYNFQLLQMSSDFDRDGERIMWGDAGIGHFFIDENKLRNKDFSDIMYYADCC